MKIPRRSRLSIPVLVISVAVAATAARAQGVYDWTWRSPLPNGESVTGAVWTGSQVVAVGMVNSVRDSPDGHAWTQKDLVSNTLVGTSLAAIARTGNQLVGVGTGGAIVTGSRKARLISVDGAVVGEPESVTANGARFSVLGIPQGACIMQWESAGRKEARAVTLAR